LGFKETETVKTPIQEIVMSFLGSIGDFASSAFHTVTNTAEDIAGTVVKGAEGAVEGAVSDVIQNPLDIFNPFAVVKGAVSGAYSNIVGDSTTLKSPFTDIAQFFQNGTDAGGVAGNSITAILLSLASKERQQLAGKVDQLKNLQVPGPGASTQDQANYDSTKVQLMADIQSIQNSISQITTMATNVEKTDHDTNMAIARNLA